MKKTVEVVVIKQAKAQSFSPFFDWPPDDLKGFFKWFATKVKEVPAEHRSSVKIVLGKQDDPYEFDDYADITITYSRPETDEEEREREAKELTESANQADLERSWEIAELIRLRAKYPNIGDLHRG